MQISKLGSANKSCPEIQHKQSSAAPMPPSVRHKPGKSSANTQKLLRHPHQISLRPGISQKAEIWEAKLWKQNCTAPKRSRNVFSPSSAPLGEGRGEKKNDIPVVFCAAAHLEAPSFLLLHSAPVLGRNPAGLGLGRGQRALGCPGGSKAFVCRALMRGGRADSCGTQKLSAPQGGGTTQARRFPGD